MKIIGVDLGGTKIESALIGNMQVMHSFSTATPACEPKEVVLEAVNQAIEKYFSSEIAGIGIGVPGLVDLEKNEVFGILNIPSWDRVPLRKLIEEKFRVPVFVNNDANCFALGEKYFGKGKIYDNFVGLTIGTGLGAGIIINGHLYSGQFCGAGEFGVMYYKDSTLEAYASGQFFRDRELSGRTIFEHAAVEDAFALKMFDKLGEHIGRAIANILFALAPEAVILGGSVSKSYHLFEKGMRNVLLNEFPYKPLYESLKIEVSDLKGSAVLGAAALVLEGLG